jgi:hypothetical protein
LNGHLTDGKAKHEPLPIISMFILDAAPQTVLPRAKRIIADNMMGRRPMIWRRR